MEPEPIIHITSAQGERAMVDPAQYETDRLRLIASGFPTLREGKREAS